MEEFHHRFFEESFFEELLCHVTIIKMVAGRSSRSSRSSTPRKVLDGIFSEPLCDVRGLLVALTLSVFSNMLFYLTTHREH